MNRPHISSEKFVGSLWRLSSRKGKKSLEESGSPPRLEFRGKVQQREAVAGV